MDCNFAQKNTSWNFPSIKSVTTELYKAPEDSRKKHSCCMCLRLSRGTRSLHQTLLGCHCSGVGRDLPSRTLLCFVMICLNMDSSIIIPQSSRHPEAITQVSQKPWSLKSLHLQADTGPPVTLVTTIYLFERQALLVSFLWLERHGWDIH